MSLVATLPRRVYSAILRRLRASDFGVTSQIRRRNSDTGQCARCWPVRATARGVSRFSPASCADRNVPLRVCRIWHRDTRFDARLRMLDVLIEFGALALVIGLPCGKVKLKVCAALVEFDGARRTCYVTFASRRVPFLAGRDGRTQSSRQIMSGTTHDRANRPLPLARGAPWSLSC